MPHIAVITGASAGIGRATAHAFARAGYRVGILARDPHRVESVCEEIRSNGGHALGMSVDVADAAQVERAADRIEHELGPISVWVNNASTTVFARVLDMTAEEYRQVTAVTYLGVVHGTMAALKRMQPRNHGSIIQIGSALAYRSIPLQSAYCAAKAAIRGFTDALRCELIHERSHVRLTMVQLSAFNTPQFDWARSKLSRRLQPVPPIFQPEIAAEAIVRAARQHSREVWVGWPAVKTILSARLVPGVGDRLAARNAYESQMTDEPAQTDRADNLFEPVPGDFGAHGRFDARAESASAQWMLSKHRWSVAALATLLIAGAAVVSAISTSGTRSGRAVRRRSTRTSARPGSE
jgi:short-subunit dehydrogenase